MDGVRYVLRPITNSLELPAHGLHAFHHANATEQDRHSIPLAVRTARLGHTRLATTMKDTHAVSEDHLRAAEILGEIFCPSLPPASGVSLKKLKTNDLGDY